MIDLMYEFEIVIRLHPVLGHQTAHGGAVALVIILLYAERLVLRHLQKIRNVGADAVVHLLPEIEVVWVERVVEIENPSLDMAETARRTRHLHAFDDEAGAAAVTRRASPGSRPVRQPARKAASRRSRRSADLFVRSLCGRTGRGACRPRSSA